MSHVSTVSYLARATSLQELTVGEQNNCAWRCAFAKPANDSSRTLSGDVTTSIISARNFRAQIMRTHPLSTTFRNKNNRFATETYFWAVSHESPHWLMCQKRGYSHCNTEPVILRHFFVLEKYGRCTVLLASKLRVRLINPKAGI